MNRAKQNRLIQYALTNIAPFDPREDNGDTIVYAHILENTMSEDELRDEGLQLFMKLYTEQSIIAAKEYFVDGSRTSEAFIPHSYTFSVNCDPESAIVEACNDIKKSAQEGWIKGRLCKESTSGVRGHLSLSLGLETKPHIEEKLPLSLDATFVPETLDTADSNYTDIKTISEVINSITNSTSHLPDHIPGLEPNPNTDSFRDEYRITIYKVGHGNTITIENTTNNNCILFDCGKGSTSDPNATNHITNKVKPNIIIFSHWHKDHCNLLDSINTTSLKLIICPNKDNLDKQPILDALASLIKQGIPFTDLSDEDFDPDFLKKYGFDGINLYIGENKGDPGDPSINPNNTLGHIDYERPVDDSGIILSIKARIHDYYAILPGDCSYYSWPDVSPDLDLLNVAKLVIPHHGGHAISQPITGQSSLFYTMIYISTNRDKFEDLSDGKSITSHRTFIHTVLSRPKEVITKNFKPGKFRDSFDF